MKHKLLTKELIKRFESIGCQDGCGDPLVIAHYFNPCGAGNWYATEYLPHERIFFGFVSLLEQEWGYFSLDELESTKVPPFGLGIEREIHFQEIRFSALAEREGYRNIFKN